MSRNRNPNEKPRLPPPPRMTPISSTLSAATRSPPRSGALPHSSTAPIDVLDSAPPSGNLNDFDLKQLAGAGAAAAGPETPTLVSSLPLPPPPPPPPPRASTKTTATATTAKSQSKFPTPPPRPPQPTIAPLPPPPIVTKTVKVEKQPKEVSSLQVEQQQQQPEPEPPQASTVSQPALQEPARLPSWTFASPKSLEILAKRQTHIPILVIATEAAHKLAWKNQLRLADLLEGLVQSVTTGTAGTSSPIVAPFRSVTRSLPLTWQDVQVTFVEPDDIVSPMTDEKAQELLQQQALLRDSDGNLQQELNLLEDKVDNLLEEQRLLVEDNVLDWYSERQRQLEQVMQDAYRLTSPLHIPWLWRYRQGLDVATDGLPHDMFQCPPLCLLVCTTQERSNPIETLRELKSTHYLPPAFHNGLFDPQAIRQEVLLLHDNVDGPKEWNEAAMKQSLLQSFGTGASIVRLNSIVPETAAQLAQEEDSDLWGGGGSKGNCLSVSDRVVIRNYLATLITTSLLPALERRVADLNIIVSDRKKGVKNVLKSFWRGGAKSKDEEDIATSATQVGSDVVKYRYDSIESQTRLLADTLFLVKDYDAALGMYRLIKDDFKQDKAMVHYGNIQEMIALCMYQLDPYGRAKDIFSNVESALLSYSRAAEEERPTMWGDKPGRPASAPQATRLGTRLCLVLTSTRNICDHRNVEVADLLASASSHETSLGAAVLLEQSSSHYFKAEMHRKYAFHMLMSGHMFRSAEQEHHAFRCFTSALYIYRDSKWEELHSHLRSALAAQLFSMGRMAVALQLYSKLVGSTNGGRVSSKSQQKFVNHVLEICNEHPKKALVGADRMAASSKLSGEKRDAVRKERLERIVQVIRYTKSASRVLELPNIDLPLIDDSTVSVIADEMSHHKQERIPSFGDAENGSDEVWEELMLMATAELKASEEKEETDLDDKITSSAIAKIDDPDIQKVIARIDKEKANRTLMERSKRSANYKEKPPVRAQMEPLAVEFAISNPLSIPIDVSDLQIVARMTDERGEHVCTNEDSIKITPLASYNESRKWTFNGSHVNFEIPDFCRVSTVGTNQQKQAWKSAEEVEPFFVVTKSNLNLEPESRRTLSVSICPLSLGNLEIIGVRCRLLDDVWVFHPFDLKGPLLQNTRSNRANRVRAESMVLKAKVERGMPCLTAELVSSSPGGSEDNGPAMQGQISTWTLRLSNVGTAAATNVVLKTNVPWVNMLDVERTDSSKPADVREKDPVSFCIGPTGTLLRLPVRGKDVKVEGQIQPGETVDIPIRIRISGAGKQEFYMLFRYELVEPDTSTQRHRWLRKMFEVPVYPSLTLSATCIPSFSSQGEHVLSVQFTNFRTDRPEGLDIVLDKLSLAGRCYRLEPFPGQLSGEAKLGWQECITMNYRVIAEEESSTCLLSECPFFGAKEPVTVEAASSSSLSFLCLERAHDKFEETLKSHQKDLVRAAAAEGHERQHPRSIAQIRRANTSFLSGASSQHGELQSEKGHPTSIARLCPPESSKEFASLVCSWKDEKGKIVGEHYIRKLSIRPLTEVKGCPITITAQHPKLVSTDFSKGPANVPIEVTLRNRLIEEPVEFEFAMDSTAEFDFVGVDRFKSALSSGEELSIPLRAMIPSSGVYNLQNVRLTVEDDEHISYLFPSLQWMVTVNEA